MRSICVRLLWSLFDEVCEDSLFVFNSFLPSQSSGVVLFDVLRESFEEPVESLHPIQLHLIPENHKFRKHNTQKRQHLLSLVFRQDLVRPELRASNHVSSVWTWRWFHCNPPESRCSFGHCAQMFPVRMSTVLFSQLTDLCHFLGDRSQ